MVGVYKITNKVNGRVYIGQSKSIGTRWGGHINKLECGKHDNKDLQNDFNHFSYNAFAFEILEECHEDMLLEREKHYINEYNDNCYNVINNVKRSFSKYNNNIFINSDIYKKFNKNIGKLTQHIILLAYKNISEDDCIEISISECSKIFGITKDFIYKNKDKILNESRKMNIFEYIEYENSVFFMKFNSKYSKVNLEIPYYDFYYNNISNHNTLKFLIYIIINKDITIKADDFKKLFGINENKEYKYLKYDYIRKILKDLNNINIKIDFNDIKTRNETIKLKFSIRY